MKDLLLLTPPFTQLNTPYPATAYLKGFLNTKGISSFQMDLGIEVILAMFSKAGLSNIFAHVELSTIELSENATRILSLQEDYLNTIEEVIRFLQGSSATLARHICSDQFLPQANRFEQLDDLEWAFGSMGMQDKAKHLATLYLEDVSDFIIECVDADFGFSRYAERLGRSANSFDELHAKLNDKPTFIDEISLSILEKRISQYEPKLVCMSVPFPGNLYSAFRCAKHIKGKFPHINVAMGGGFPNTELRNLKDKRVMEYFDFISLDDGELPVELIWSNIIDPTPANPNHLLLKRTYFLPNGELEYNNFSIRKDYPQAQVGTPDYTDLLLDQYIHVIELTNPMHSLWSDGRWNKLTMAHGCYWGKCTFCDVSLDYIKNYEGNTAVMLVDRMELMISQTGERGFHFVDEAAPPALMRDLAIEIIRRKLVVTWWTNIRFEKSFTKDLCKLLMASGCIAVSGGLEVASDRLLDVIQKGVTVAQVAQVTHHFTNSGIMVHAYLMYGYPTQTVQETVDSLEMVRQLFESGVLQSGFWHQFALTAHSPVGLSPDEYGILPKYKEISFAHNDIDFEDSTGIDHNQFSSGLKKSIYNFMHGVGLEEPLSFWFDFRIPKTTVAPDYITNCIEAYYDLSSEPKSHQRLWWIGNIPQTMSGEDEEGPFMQITCHSKTTSFSIETDASLGEWLLEQIVKMHVNEGSGVTYQSFKSSFEHLFGDLAPFWQSEHMTQLLDAHLLIL